MRKEFTKIAASAMAAFTLASAITASAPVLAATIYDDPNSVSNTYPGDDAAKATEREFTTFRGDTVKVNCVNADGKIWLVDKKRNIRVITDGVYNTFYDSTGKYERLYAPSNLYPLNKDDNTWNTKAEMLYNVGQVYDFFKKTLRIDNFDFSFSGDQGLYVFEFDHPCDARSYIQTDGRSKCEDIPANLLGFGQDDSKDDSISDKRYYHMGVDIGAIGHELTHLLVNRELGWWPEKMDTETEALMEAYCDIIGELCEEEPDWKVAADVFKENTPTNKKYSFRDMKNPTATQNPKYDKLYIEMYDDYSNYMRNYENLKSNNPYASVMQAAYLGTTVIDHAAYLMSESIPKDQLAIIWYCSIFNYGKNAKNATFVDCRNAVERAASKIYGSSSAQLKAVQAAFDQVKVKKHSTSLSQADAVSAQHISDFVRNESYKFPDGRYWNTGDPDTTSRYSKGNDTNTCLPMGPTTLPGFRSLFWQNEEPYYQCAGFAKKLQVDYYGTDTFLQNPDAKNYVPEFGDHLRVELYRRNEYMGTHSVFVREVGKNNTLIFADCNYNKENVIRWTKKVNYSRDIDNNFYMSDGVYTYRFVWVERPIKQGDANADGVINYDDLTAMDNIINGNVSYRMHDGLLREFTADINGDYIIDYNDKELLRQIISNEGSARQKYGFVIY